MPVAEDFVRPDPNKSDPDQDGLPGISSEYWIRGYKKIHELPEKEQTLVRDLMKRNREIKEHVKQLQKKYGESDINVIKWQAYGLLLQHAVKLKLLEPYLKKDFPWLVYLIDFAVMAISYQAKRIKLI